MTEKEYIERHYSSEDQFSAATFQYINHNYPELRKFIFHVPNGGQRSKKEALLFQAMGLVPGIPDYICVYPLFALELKLPGGHLSPAQKIIHQIWEGKVPKAICYTPEQVINFIQSCSKSTTKT
jgi:hypothetical protein